MGMVHEEITLKNAGDEINAHRGIINEKEIRQATVTAVVDTGAITLVINEKLRQQLGLGIRGERQVTLADNIKHTVKKAEPVEVWWKNRSMICDPLVVSDEGKVLLGAIPLEDMDLMVDPVHQKLVGIHGDEVVSYLY